MVAHRKVPTVTVIAGRFDHPRAERLRHNHRLLPSKHAHGGGRADTVPCMGILKLPLDDLRSLASSLEQYWTRSYARREPGCGALSDVDGNRAPQDVSSALHRASPQSLVGAAREDQIDFESSAGVAVGLKSRAETQTAHRTALCLCVHVCEKFRNRLNTNQILVAASSAVWLG